MAQFVRIGIEGGTAGGRERATAEAYAAGAVGLEERPHGVLVLYAPARVAQTVWRALAAVGEPGLAIGEPRQVAEEDWTLSWRQGLEAVVVSPRLVVKPSFIRFEAAAGQSVLVIDPGQAFGTGGHATTRLALSLLADLDPAALVGSRVLDLGCGTGVLALAALRLGASRAVACDLDPLASEASRDNAERNGCAEGLGVFTGSLAALGQERFELGLANMIRSELFPLLPGLVDRLVVGGTLILSGLLAADLRAARKRCTALGLDCETQRKETDATGDAWLALRLRRGP